MRGQNDESEGRKRGVRHDQRKDPMVASKENDPYCSQEYGRYNQSCTGEVEQAKEHGCGCCCDGRFLEDLANHGTEEQLEKFVALMRAYNELEGSAWQTNCISVDTLREAQKHPENYSNLLVRITGYNAYFTTIGKALQDEVIARTEHMIR